MKIFKIKNSKLDNNELSGNDKNGTERRCGKASKNERAGAALNKLNAAEHDAELNNAENNGTEHADAEHNSRKQKSLRLKRYALPAWKKKKRISFHVYFTILMASIICVSVACATLFEKITDDWLSETLQIPDFLILIIISLIVGTILSHIMSELTLSPVKKIRNAMSKVASGNFDVAVSEKSKLDEIEDINHAFNIMVKELRSMEVIQSDFVSNVSHELKTPLTAIDGYAAMLKQNDLSSDEHFEYCDKILFNARRMSVLVNNILLLSKLDNQGIESKKQNFSLDEQIRQEIVATENKWSEKNLDLDVKLQEITYCGNQSLLSHVWSNLLGNAIKFSPEGGKITLELKKGVEKLFFSVSDEGNGVDENAKKYLFDKFYQSDTSHKQEGNGLGLALVKKITDLCGGEVFVENLQPKGCRFTVVLPL